MDPHLSRNTPGRTSKAQQKGSEYPVRQRPLALVQQGIGKVVEGALAAMAPVAFAPGAVLVRAPAANVVALAPGTLQWTIFPPERMDVCLALFGVEKLVQMREHQHGWESPGVVKPVLHWVGDSHIFMTFWRSYKPR
jgi:hypothetical protein